MKKIILLFAIAFFGVSLSSVAQARYSKSTKIEKFNHKKKHLSKKDRIRIRAHHKAYRQSRKMAMADGRITKPERRMLKKQRHTMKRKINRKRASLRKNDRLQPRGQRRNDYLGDFERRQ